MLFSRQFIGAKKFDFKCSCTFDDLCISIFPPFFWQCDTFFLLLVFVGSMEEVEKENRGEKIGKESLELWKIYSQDANKNR